MVITTEKNVENLVVDTTAFIQTAQLQDIGQNIITCQEVVDEITSKRQLRRLVVLPYDLKVKNVDPENVCIITDFAKKTGDYPSLSATDIKVMALTYQLEKEHVGTEHLKSEPVMQRTVNIITTKQTVDMNADVTGFYLPGQKKNIAAECIDDQKAESEEKLTNEECTETENLEHDKQTNLEELNKKLLDKFEALDVSDEYLQSEGNVDEILANVTQETEEVNFEESSEEESGDESDWITPSNIEKAKKQVNSELMEERSVKVACITTDFAMQNVLKQINLNVAALDGRLIKQLRTFILRCYTCFGTTSLMTKLFCPKCGNKTLKRVAVSLDEEGKQQIHINARKPLTGRGKKFSLPKIQGGKHSSNPLLVEDQPIPDQRPTRLARTKNNPLDDDYIAGFSPFVLRDVTSKSAQLKIRPASEVKHWMRRNPNEPGRRKKK